MTFPIPAHIVTQAILDAHIDRHEKFMRGQRGGIRAILKHKDLQGLDFSGHNLSQVDFTGSALAGADFTGSNLSNAIFYGCDLTRANLEGANLKRIDLRGVTAGNAKLTDADLTMADLREGRIMHRGAKGELVLSARPAAPGWNTFLRGAKMSGVTMKSTQARMADFTEADLSNAIMQQADFEDAQFIAANLTGSDLTGAVLTRTNMQSALLLGAQLRPAERLGLDLTGAITDHEMARAYTYLSNLLPDLLDKHVNWVTTAGKSGARLDLSGYDARRATNLSLYPLIALKAVETSFLGLDLSGASLQSSQLDRSDFRDCKLNNTDLRGSSLKYALFTRASLRDANFSALTIPRKGGQSMLQRVNLSGADFRFADLAGADFSNAILMGANLGGADLTRANFRGADLTGTTLDGALTYKTEFDNPDDAAHS